MKGQSKLNLLFCSIYWRLNLANGVTPAPTTALPLRNICSGKSPICFFMLKILYFIKFDKGWWWMFILGLKVGNTTNVSLWIMGGCDSLSPPLLGCSSSFSFLRQSHYKAIKGYELVQYKKKKKKSLNLHKYRHKYTQTSTKTNILSLQVIEQSLKPNPDSAPRMFNFINHHVKHFIPLQESQ